VSSDRALSRQIRGELLDLAQEHLDAAECASDVGTAYAQLAAAVFLTAGALESALRDLCDVNGVHYEPLPSIAILQAALYEPTGHVALIKASDNERITCWGKVIDEVDAKGWLAMLTHSEVLPIVCGVRAFVETYLP
jgi:hypothetical protein